MSGNDHRKSILVKLTAIILLVAVFSSACATPVSEEKPSSPADEQSIPIKEEVPPDEASVPLTLSYAPCEYGGFPQKNYRHPLGEEYAFGGTLTGSMPLKSIRMRVISIYNADPALYPAEAVVYLNDGERDSVDLAEFNSLMDFSAFTPGVHILQVIAATDDGNAYLAAEQRFYVLGDEWLQLDESSFYDSLPETMAFFQGDTEKFLFRYQWVQDRYIMADPDWEEAYITYREAYPEGNSWSMHADAVANFEKAMGFLENTHVRISGTNGDSGILPLCALIKTYNGCYVPRFTSSKQYISHHSFGTAIDLNAGMQANLNTAENKALIAHEVGECLSYEGIREENGVSYYGFHYDGTYEQAYLGVPESIINYLLYEFAFYRSGFTWAHYYASTSDGMHFALTEYVTGDHDGENGLRKVFEYISEIQ